MKYLTDKEILSWNDRIGNREYRVNAVYSNQNGYPNIAIYQNYYTTYDVKQIITDQKSIQVDPDIKYVFSFSVASNRVETFFDIYGRLRKEEFYTKLVNKNDSLIDIKFDDNAIRKKEKIDHKISDKEYTRFTYTFVGKLSNIMLHVAYLEDAIEFFQKIWGYDESGKEFLLIKFPIGSIVSKIDDKSVDYLIFEYDYKKSTNGEYSINYIVCEMLKTGPIIKYGSQQTFYEDDLCFSRNGRINDILS